MKLQGGCLCGAMRYEIDGPLYEVGNCHCSMCRRFHGTGIATELLAAAKEHARRHLHDVLWLGVSEHNARAIAFYRKHGFKSLGVHKVGAGHHEHEDVLMSCQVSSC